MPAMTLIAPRGELDLIASRELAPQLSQAVGDTARALVVDLSDVSFIDSTGLGALVQAHQRAARQGRRVAIVAPDGSAAAVLLDLSGLRDRLLIFRTRDAAVEALED
jgi:anti-sigma B factor antagonist